jgi:hypothetical protein
MYLAHFSISTAATSMAATAHLPLPISPIGLYITQQTVPEPPYTRDPVNNVPSHMGTTVTNVLTSATTPAQCPLAAITGKRDTTFRRMVAEFTNDLPVDASPPVFSLSCERVAISASTRSLFIIMLLQ